MAQRRKLRYNILEKSGTTLVGLPSSTSFTVLLAGAVVKSGATISDGTSGDIEVFHPGRILDNHSVYLMTWTTKAVSAISYTVNSVDLDGGSLWQVNVTVPGGAGNLTFVAGDRLIIDEASVTAGKATLYRDDMSTTTISNPQVATDTGEFEAWLTEVDVDLKIVADGATAYDLDVPTDGRREVINPAYWGAVANDDTLDSQPAWLRAVKFGEHSTTPRSKIVADAGKFYFSEKVPITKADLRIELQEATYIYRKFSGGGWTGAATDPLFDIQAAATQVHFEGGRLFSGTSGHMIDVGADAVSIERVVFDGSDDPAGVGNGAVGIQCTGKARISIRDCLFTELRTYGIDIINCQYGLIYNNQFLNIGGGASDASIHFDASSGDTSYFVVSTNVIRRGSGAGWGIFLEGDNATPDNLKGISLLGNTVVNTTVAAVQCLDCVDIVVANNQLHDGSTFGIFYSNVNGGVISGNMIRNFTTDGIGTAASTLAVSIFGNIIKECDQNGISLQTASKIEMIGNVANDNNQAAGGHEDIDVDNTVSETGVHANITGSAGLTNNATSGDEGHNYVGT